MADEAVTGPTYQTVDFFPVEEKVHDDFWAANTAVREICPVGWTTSMWSPSEPPGQWIINDYADTMEAASDWKTFSSAEGIATVQYPLEIMRMVPVETDPPQHREIRKALNPFLAPVALAEVDGEIHKRVDQLMADCLQQDGAVDFVESFTALLPPVVFLGPGFLNQGPEKAKQLVDLVTIMLTTPERAMEAASQLLEWCSEVLETCRSEGRRHDLPGTIAHLGLGEGGFELTDRERTETLNTVVMGGMETVTGGIGIVAWLLATRPELRNRLRSAQEQELNRAVEEFLRFASPVPTEARTLTRDHDLRSCPMKKGDRVLLNYAAANFDPVQFTDPLELDFERPNVASHLAFGAGIHRCVGAHLARREIKASIRAICDLEQFELQPGHEIKFRPSFVRGPVELPVLIKP